jgi:hypothetical protein
VQTEAERPPGQLPLLRHRLRAPSLRANTQEWAARMPREFFHDHEGRLRNRRALIATGVLALVAFGGTTLCIILLVVIQPPAAIAVVLAVGIIGCKLPLLVWVWRLMGRHMEIPGKPVVWSTDETREILGYLTRQAEASLGRPDAAARLAWLTQEAWYVADRADGPLKADAVGVALEIAQLADTAARRPQQRRP